jgi:hypothetical protein
MIRGSEFSAAYAGKSSSRQRRSRSRAVVSIDPGKDIANLNVTRNIKLGFHARIHPALPRTQKNIRT